jgi:hypothetical protein
MGPVTEAMHARLANDGTLISLLAAHNGEPAVFTTEPVPGKAEMPYIVTAGEAASRPFDTKTSRGREIWRDVRCYAAASGSAERVEAMAERVYALLHRLPLAVEGFGVLLAECTGPIVADEDDAYGRVVTVRMIMIEEEV